MAALPWDSAVGRAIEAPDPAVARWGNLEELLALNTEVLDLHARQFVLANSKKGTAAPKPYVKILRPGEAEKKKKRKATPEEIRRFFGNAVRYTPPPST